LDGVSDNWDGRSVIVTQLFGSHKWDLSTVTARYVSYLFIIGSNHDTIKQSRFLSRFDTVGDDGETRKYFNIFSGYPFASPSGRDNGDTHF
jgi:hypothetical protein